MDAASHFVITHHNHISGSMTKALRKTSIDGISEVGVARYQAG
jgi:hypothetical protein